MPLCGIRCSDFDARSASLTAAQAEYVDQLAEATAATNADQLERAPAWPPPAGRIRAGASHAELFPLGSNFVVGRARGIQVCQARRGGGRKRGGVARMKDATMVSMMRRRISRMRADATMSRSVDRVRAHSDDRGVCQQQGGPSTPLGEWTTQGRHGSNAAGDAKILRGTARGAFPPSASAPGDLPTGPSPPAPKRHIPLRPPRQGISRGIRHGQQPPSSSASAPGDPGFSIGPARL